MVDTITEGNEGTFRAGYAAIVGAPNAGKSTLMNSLLGQKLSIVSSKPQTTRHRIIGILSDKNFQIVFLDTPGLLEPKYALHSAMMGAADRAIRDADVVLFIVDGSDTDEKELAPAFERLRNLSKPVILALNKIDLMNAASVKSRTETLSAKYAFRSVTSISALKGENTPSLIHAIATDLPEHPPYYPPDALTEHPEKFFVSEIIREKVFEQYRQEIPYSTSVDILEFTEEKGKKDIIRAEIYVERDSQKGIMIGKKGLALKALGENARKDIETFLGRRVYLELYVKVRDQWRNKDEWLKRLGYE